MTKTVCKNALQINWQLTLQLAKISGIFAWMNFLKIDIVILLVGSKTLNTFIKILLDDSNSKLCPNILTINFTLKRGNIRFNN